MVFHTPDVANDHDSALAAENMMLADYSAGIGSCWIGLARGIGKDKDLHKETRVSKEYKLVAPLIFGNSAKGELKTPARKNDVILKWII